MNIKDNNGNVYKKSMFSSNCPDRQWIKFIDTYGHKIDGKDWETVDNFYMDFLHRYDSDANCLVD